MTPQRFLIQFQYSKTLPRLGHGLRALLLSTILFSAGSFTGCASSSKTAADAADVPIVAVAKADRKDLASTLNIASEFQPFQEISVYAKVSGYIQKLNVDWGSHVKQGQLLAVLEIPELEQQIQHDEASLAEAREELNRAQSAYAVAHVTYQRLAAVQKTRPELISQQDIDVAQGKDLEANAGVSAAEQSLLAAKAALEKDKTLYGYARITAPFDGVVTEIDAYAGALLPAGTSSNKGDQPLCHLADDRVLRLVIPVPESAVPNIRPGGKVEVRVTVLKKTFQGSVARIVHEVDLSTRTMHTEIDVPNPNLEIVPGMYAEASLALQEKRNALAIPVQALSRQEAHTTVFVVDPENKIQERTIQIGLETSNDVEVVSGLSDGQMVVVGNRSQLRPGMAVRPKQVSSSVSDEAS
jgi:RND family efflux transporter MFP subunit